MSQPESDDEPLFRRDGERLVPTELTQGPWSPEHQHGGAVCAALAWAVEREPTPVPMRVVRVVFDLLHPAPLRPLRPRAQLVRSGRRVQLLDVALLEGERIVARASALRVRVDPGLALEEALRGRPGRPLARRPWDLPRLTVPRRFQKEGGPVFLPGYMRAVDFRRGSLEPRNGEPGMGWSRLERPVVDGEEPSPFVRLASQADFVSGIANGLDFTRFLSINPELVLHVDREPVSDWVGFEAVTRIGRDGVGQSVGTLHDLEGPVGRAESALYVAPR